MSAQAKLEALLHRVQRNRGAARVVPFDEAVTTPGNVMSPTRPSPLEAALGAQPRAKAAPASHPIPVARPVKQAQPARPAVATPVTKPTAGVRPAPAAHDATPTPAAPIRIEAPAPAAHAAVASATGSTVSVAPKTFGELFARSIALRPRR